MTFQKLDLFPSSGEGGEDLLRANLNHWTTPVRFTQVISSSTVIPKVSLTRSLIPRVAVI
jgi:hypothetical protein